MLKRIPVLSSTRAALVFVAVCGLCATTARAQDRLKSMPGYDQYTKMSAQLLAIARSGVTPTWSDDSRSFRYQWEGKWYRFDVASRTAVEMP